MPRKRPESEFPPELFGFFTDGNIPASPGAMPKNAINYLNSEPLPQIPQTAVAPDDKAPESEAPIANDLHILEARKWSEYLGL